MFLIAALVPGVTTQVATFQIVNSFGMFDTLWAPIALYMGTDIVSIYIFLQFVRSIPTSLDESARLDGANAFTIYRRIIFPLLKPATATVVIVKGITVYNDFYIPFLYMPSEDLGVISTSLFRFKGPFSAHWETIPAGAILVILPTLIVFLCLQRYIHNGFTRGGDQVRHARGRRSRTTAHRRTPSGALTPTTRSPVPVPPVRPARGEPRTP